MVGLEIQMESTQPRTVTLLDCFSGWLSGMRDEERRCDEIQELERRRIRVCIWDSV